MKPTGSNTVFYISDLERSIEFYSNRLGFRVDFRFGNPAYYAGLTIGNVCLHISSRYPYKNNTGHGIPYISVEEVDNLNDRLVKAGMKFYCPVGNREYGLRDFALKDPDGNQVGIGVVLQERA
ncbi:MAG TPA: VOC family protein [Nitrospiraceae bacterium]|nr:VOC family protein [Nitrospiraceae bacterium]